MLALVLCKFTGIVPKHPARLSSFFFDFLQGLSVGCSYIVKPHSNCLQQLRVGAYVKRGIFHCSEIWKGYGGCTVCYQPLISLLREISYGHARCKILDTQIIKALALGLGQLLRVVIHRWPKVWIQGGVHDVGLGCVPCLIKFSHLTKPLSDLRHLCRSGVRQRDTRVLQEIEQIVSDRWIGSRYGAARANSAERKARFFDTSLLLHSIGQHSLRQMDNAQRLAIFCRADVWVVHGLVKITGLSRRNDRGFELAGVVLRFDPVEQVNRVEFCIAGQVRERLFSARDVVIAHLAFEHAQKLVFLHWTLQICHHFVQTPDKRGFRRRNWRENWLRSPARTLDCAQLARCGGSAPGTWSDVGQFHRSAHEWSDLERCSDAKTGFPGPFYALDVRMEGRKTHLIGRLAQKTRNSSVSAGVRQCIYVPHGCQSPGSLPLTANIGVDSGWTACRSQFFCRWLRRTAV